MFFEHRTRYHRVELMAAYTIKPFKNKNYEQFINIIKEVYKHYYTKKVLLENNV